MRGDPPIGEDDLHAYVDERLAPERRERVEAYLAAQPEAAERAAAYREQRAALRARLGFKEHEAIPARLRVASIMAGRSRWPSLRLTRVAAAAGWLLLGSASGWFAHDRLGVGSAPMTRGAERPLVTSEAAAAHRTFAVEVAHPVEVPASQQAHLVQWLSKRLRKPLVAPDLTGLGFRLMGGRLLPAGSDAAAQFMYDDEGGARLTLYVRAGESGETAFRFAQQGDLSSFSWIDRGLGYVVSGAVGRDRLSTVAKAVYDQLEAALPPAKPAPL